MKNYNLKRASTILIPRPLFIEDNIGEFLFTDDIKIKNNEHFSTFISNMNEQFNLKGINEKIILIHDSSLAIEEYKLEIKTDRIEIKGSNEKGLFAAMQTIRQLLISNENYLPCCLIEDKPKFSWRSFFIDCSRNFVTVKELKKLIDIAALHHFNTFQWHLTDDQAWRLDIPSLPKLVEIGAKRQNVHYEEPYISHKYYKEEDVKEIVEYAKKRYITIVPEIETPGHVRALLAAYPQYGCTKGPYEVLPHWGIFEEVLCFGNEDLIPFLKKIIDYTASVFPGPYIHIGGDECPRTSWKKCPSCQKKMKELGLKSEEEIQSYLTCEIAKLVIDAGKTPIGWDEVLEGTENLGLPKDLIVMSWRGLKGGIEASKLGHKVIMCPNTGGCYYDYKNLDREEEPGNIGVNTLKDVCNFSPIAKEMNQYQQSMVLGGQGLIWTEKVEFSKNLEYLLYPRLSILAEQLWNPCGFDEFEKRKQVLIERLRKLDINCYSGPSY